MQAVAGFSGSIVGFSLITAALYFKFKDRIIAFRFAPLFHLKAADRPYNFQAAFFLTEKRCWSIVSPIDTKIAAKKINTPHSSTLTMGQPSKQVNGG